MILISICFPMIAGLAVSLKQGLAMRQRKLLYAGILLVTDLLAATGAAWGGNMVFLTVTDRVKMAVSYDSLGRFTLAAVLLIYTASCFYAFEYMDHEERPESFFAWFFISLGAMIAVCASANPVTLYCFFEFATLSSMPMVLHDRTREAVAAALKYLFYSMGGALLGLLAIFFVYHFAGADTDFTLGGFLDAQKAAGHEGLLLGVLFAGIVGFGTKAGLYPMHGWLPSAHPIAPAPASALLSGIIAKAGVLAVIRLIYYCAGAQLVAGTWVQTAWKCLAMLTIFMGSMMAFREKVLKKRLAYSTISQISYILLGLSCLSQEGLQGSLIQLISHASAKGCLFMAAGAFIVCAGKRRVSELKGIGLRMPLVLGCFAIASLSLVGIPPMGGFTAKWAIASAAIADGSGILSFLPPVVLIISALLTAGYLLPTVVDGFFPGNAGGEEGVQPAQDGTKIKDPSLLMTLPMALLCAAALVMGLFGSRIAASLF